MIESFKTALLSIWSNKVRSILNILGVVIGVASVTILIALGQGLKNDVANLIQGFGTNVITITGGKLEPNNLSSGNSNPANFISGDIITMTDVATLEQHPDLREVSPINLVAGSMKYEDKTATPSIFGTYPNFLTVFEFIALEKGEMFDSRDAGNVVVIGSQIAQSFFGEADPLGKIVTINNREVEVVGVIALAKSSILANSEFETMALLPFDTATSLNKGNEKVFRLYVSANDGADVEQVKAEIKEALLANHDGEDDFSVLTQDDLLDLLGTFLNLATAMVSAIAAISLVVGGLGIMNIMLVTVTERTREIGLRKAVGATKLAIAFQFLIEAITVTFVGALIGLVIAFIAALIVASQTELKPAITPQVILLAVGISVVIGVIFGLWPAIGAAQKDPIEALRYE